MYKNFYITGFGRSGTSFLKNIMNQSKKWIVEHEPRNKFDEANENPVPKIQSDLDKDYYGEVNSRLRSYIFKLQVDKMGIIIRDPRDIFLSTMNRGKNYKQMALDIWTAYQRFVFFEGDCLWIDFYKMTTSNEYLRGILNHFGIKDISSFDFKKVNENKTITYKKFDQLPLLWQDVFYSYDWSIMNELHKRVLNEALYSNQV